MSTLDPSGDQRSREATRPLAPLGSASARSLLMTVLGEFVLPNGGSAWTRTLLELGEHLALRPKSTRQALSRLESRGHLERERIGRETRWRLTDAATDLLTVGAERIYGFGRSDHTWDRRWLIALASIPERDRNTRYRMTVELRWLGFGSLGQGLWLCPWSNRESATNALFDRLDIDATIFRAELGEHGTPRELAARAWDLPALDLDYQAFLDTVDQAHPTSGADAAAQLTSLVHRWRGFPFADPDLPDELLPVPWTGHTAATTFTRIRDELSPVAQAWWQEIDD